jgi:hypothetical protein
VTAKGGYFLPRKKQKIDASTQKRSIVFPTQQLDEMEKMANSRNVFVADIVREFVDKGLTVQSYKEDTEYITGIIRQTVSAEIGKQANRLAAMLFKIGIISAGNYFMAVRLMSDVISPSMQEDFKDINSNARKLGIDYMKQSGVGVVEFLEDTDEVNAAVQKLKTDFTE